MQRAQPGDNGYVHPESPVRRPSPLPWIVAFIEGFSTLAVEVIAIRLAIPIVGSSITLTGVMLGVVLLALSAGYWRGGTLSARWDRSRTAAILSRNLLLAAVLYGALAFPLEALALEKFLDFGFSLAMAIGAAASLLFLLPIYLASQTVPMLAELTDLEGKAGKASGKVLFFSTVGSVAGGIITPVWLFPSIGVARSTWLVCGLLAAAALLMSAPRLRSLKALGFGTAALAAVAAANALLFASQGKGFYFDSAYQTIRIASDEAAGRKERVLYLGGGRASGIYADNGATSFEYVRAAGRALEESRAENVLVIGAAGFTFPRDAAAMSFVRQVDAVDVDPMVKQVAEREFLQRPLPPKIRFLPLSARYAVRRLRRDGRHYGFAFVDAYFGKGIPDELVTVEFFKDLHEVADRIAVNAILDPDMESAFAVNLLASFREAFGGVWVLNTNPTGEFDTTNVRVTNWAAQGSSRWNGTGHVYHDDKNAADRDHVALIWE
jgi:hypothetical protein